MPGLVLSIGILVTFRFLDLPARWYGSALGAHLSWTLPFGLLIMFAILGRLSPAYEEAAYDLGASRWQAVRHVVIPIVFPGMIAVALFGFTLSYDEFPRSWLTVGSKNTLPIEIWTMTTNVTSPALYALGTVTTVDLLRRDRARHRRRSPIIQRKRRHGKLSSMLQSPPQSVRQRRRAERQRRDPARQPDQDVRQPSGGQVDQPDGPARLLLLHDRAFRLRQDDDPAHDRRPRDADLGRGLHRRPDGRRAGAGAARNGADVPELCAVPASQRARQRRLQSENARRRQRGALRSGVDEML